MIYSFGSGEKTNVEVIDAMDCREARGFAPYSGENGYHISTKQIRAIKLVDMDERILGILSRFPLLSSSSIEALVGKGAARRVADLYDAGILSRFAELDKGNGELFASAYFISENGFSRMGKAARLSGFPAGSVEDMTVPKRIEVSVLSTWVAYTNHFYGRRETKLISYTMPNQAHPYLEAIICKSIKVAWHRISAKCRFHILCRPKSQDAMIPFLETLVYFEGLARQEEQRMVDGCSRSFVVILCESEENMEKFALEMEQVFRARGISDMSEIHFLYSLESDAMDGLGAFKFLSGISFPEGMVKRQQVAFR